MKKKIFITGATGCVGHYLSEIFLNDPGFEVFLFVRDPGKFKFDLKHFNNLTVLQGNLLEIEKYRDVLSEVNYVIHTATSWGGHEGANIEAVNKILELVNPKIIKRIYLFSTASILGDDNKLTKAADEYGTHYVRSKYHSYLSVEKSVLSDKIVHVFPTLIIGGDNTHPFSDFGKGLLEVHKTIKWAKYFYLDLGFHFIHAGDIAKVVKHHLDNDSKEGDVILGNDYILLKEFIKKVANFFGKRVWFQIKIPNWFINILIKFNKKRISSWDIYSFKKKYFKFNVTNCKTLGIESTNFDIHDILKAYR